MCRWVVGSVYVPLVACWWQVAFTGGLLALVGTLSSAFVTELTLLYLTLGALVGTGMAFALSQSLVIVSHYFHRRLGLVSMGRRL